MRESDTEIYNVREREAAKISQYDDWPDLKACRVYFLTTKDFSIGPGNLFFALKCKLL